MAFISELSQLSEISTELSDFAQLGYLGLFISSFLAATILPFSSEVVFSALLLSGLSPLNLVVVATVGNVLGSVTNYGLGLYMRNWTQHRVSRADSVKKWLRLSEDDMVQAEERFGKYGLFVLCFAWVPVIGDALTVIAGMLRVKLVWFLLLVTLGKCLRYVAVVYIAGNYF